LPRKLNFIKCIILLKITAAAMVIVIKIIITITTNIIIVQLQVTVMVVVERIMGKFPINLRHFAFALCSFIEIDIVRNTITRKTIAIQPKVYNLH